ncbi:Ig-like domain-containing protein [Clostridium sp. MB05]|uniref:Ig-like domain-containing protein n=1 Tax=Clostridium sp. MB05 TaxID=3376682 RepID=UPI003981F130
MNKKLFSKIIIISVITISSTLVSCQNTSKKITISDNTKNTISSEENEINQAIKTAEEYLNENNFDEAKEYFNKAISLDKTNKDIYLKIKDIYMSLNRFDDAYFIVKTALTNNVDIENMKLILKDISSNFESINMTLSIYQNTNYTLPNEVKTVISGNTISLPITWDNQVVDSSTVGTFIYEGFNEEYGRKAKMEITVLENVYDKQIGWVKNFYTDNGKLYIDVDLIEFYLGREDALREAIKDGKAGIDENGEYFLPAPVWIRNNSDAITTYSVSNDCIYSLCSATLNLENHENRGTLVNTSYDDFLKEFNDTKNNKSRILLVWVDIKNGSVFKISEQYLP